MLFEVELIINNTPLTYIYSNTIICYFADSCYILLTQHLLIRQTASVTIVGIGGDMNNAVNLRESQHSLMLMNCASL